ncbi:hypothetical protein RDI58_008083 [Solanum bulbocastanum]|uniref:C2H2-type domain-containing protein n=1 Tax=Solanum bulbocastanum TaxID=147425 RepID=A0AAN8TV20_SOLBU
METHMSHHQYERRPIYKSKAPASKWFKEWVPQDVVATGGKCYVLKWVNEATLKTLKEKPKEAGVPVSEPEPTTEVLFLCSYEGCGKTFIDAGALRKHSHIHGERQYVCHYEGCGKKFLDSSKLKRHFLIHTGERDYVCPHEGCGKFYAISSSLKPPCDTTLYSLAASHMDVLEFIQSGIISMPPPSPTAGLGIVKFGERHWGGELKEELLLLLIVLQFHRFLLKSMQAFSLDFNLRSHMKTHSQENYHICPYPECGKRYAHEYKLKNHISSTHQKNNTPDAHAHAHAHAPKYTPPVEKPVKTLKSSSAAYGSSSSDRPYSCPYEGCDKSYIHEYKLNLHLRNMHPGHFPEENARNVQSTADNEMDEGSDQDAYAARRGNGRIQKQSRPKPSLKQPPLKVARKSSSSAAQVNLSISKKPWPIKDENFNEEDSEETEEERDDVGDGWRYGENDDDDEETEEDD